MNVVKLILDLTRVFSRVINCSNADKDKNDRPYNQGIAQAAHDFLHSYYYLPWKRQRDFM